MSGDDFRAETLGQFNIGPQTCESDRVGLTAGLAPSCAHPPTPRQSDDGTAVSTCRTAQTSPTSCKRLPGPPPMVTAVGTHVICTQRHSTAGVGGRLSVEGTGLGTWSVASCRLGEVRPAAAGFVCWSVTPTEATRGGTVTTLENRSLIPRKIQ